MEKISWSIHIYRVKKGQSTW